MSKNFGFKILLFIILLCVPLIIGMTLHASANSSGSTIVGTLSAIFDNQNGTVTAMLVGYRVGEPVIIGPFTWTSSVLEFAHAKAEDIGNTLCGKDYVIKRVTKSINTGKEIVAEVVIVEPGLSILGGR